MAGSVVLITGCSEGGIGAALCEAFLSRGAVVYATARRLEWMQSLAAQGARTLALDVTSDDSVRDAVKAVASETGGRIDVLVNNAGIGLVGPLAEIELAQAKQLWETNYFGVLRMVQAVAPYMAQRRSGKVVNIGSIVGLISSPWGGIYSSSKAAVHSLTDALRLEMAPFGIQVLLVMPGAIKSNIGANNLQRLEGAEYGLYQPFQAKIRERATMSQGAYSTPTAVFARRVVDQVLRARPPAHFACGHWARLFQFLMWMPLWLRDRVFAKKMGLNVRLPPPPAQVAQQVAGGGKAD